MKKTISLFFMLFLFGVGSAQTNLTTAVDFTETDINGVQRHLFEILDAGQYVCLDFFFVN